MADQHHTVSDYTRTSLTGTECIIRLVVVANNFEIKPSVIQILQQFIQFDGWQDEDLDTYFDNILEIYASFKINGAMDDAFRLRLFPFSLRGLAKQWLYSLLRGLIITAPQMVEKFLIKYFPLAKTT